jgi:hypothetical protein
MEEKLTGGQSTEEAVGHKSSTYSSARRSGKSGCKAVEATVQTATTSYPRHKQALKTWLLHENHAVALTDHNMNLAG